MEQESQEQFLGHQQELQKLARGGGGGSLPSKQLQALEEATHQVATQLKDVD